jgi:hypothetical protein
MREDDDPSLLRKEVHQRELKRRRDVCVSEIVILTHVGIRFPLLYFFIDAGLVLLGRGEKGGGDNKTSCSLFREIDTLQYIGSLFR